LSTGGSSCETPCGIINVEAAARLADSANPIMAIPDTLIPEMTVNASRPRSTAQAPLRIATDVHHDGDPSTRMHPVDQQSVAVTTWKHFGHLGKSPPNAKWGASSPWGARHSLRAARNNSFAARLTVAKTSRYVTSDRRVLPRRMLTYRDHVAAIECIGFQGGMVHDVSNKALRDRRIDGLHRERADQDLRTLASRCAESVAVPRRSVPKIRPRTRTRASCSSFQAIPC